MDNDIAQILQKIAQMLQKHQTKINNNPKIEYILSFLNDIDFIIIMLRDLANKIDSRKNELDNSTNMPELLERNKNAILSIINIIENCLNNELQISTAKMRINATNKQYNIQHTINALSLITDKTILAIKKIV